MAERSGGSAQHVGPPKDQGAAAITGEEDVTRGAEVHDPTAVLSLLADQNARSILAATVSSPQTVPDLVTECDIPAATAYRKVEALVDVGLLHERIRIRPHGRNANEYRLATNTINIQLTDSDTPTVHLLTPRSL